MFFKKNLVKYGYISIRRINMRYLALRSASFSALKWRLVNVFLCITVLSYDSQGSTILT
uniref:Uncharacterized protein n=1 Tax=Arundo donax TaxID=35708 RepID=A0A0A9H5X7_ARUDO